MELFNGLGMGLGNISRLSNAKTRSITPENVYGEKGKGGMAEVSATPQPEVERIGQMWTGPNSHARDLGRPWKVRPCIALPPGETTIMDVDGPGCIQHIWMTMDCTYFRDMVIRIFWDHETTPSVEVPIGDFFCNGFNTRTFITSLPINVNPNGGLNSFFPMPFRKHARITLENRRSETMGGVFYAINYALTGVGDYEAYFHAQFRRTNPLPYKEDYVILDGVQGHGHYVGTYLAWQQNNKGWWGEGEIKFFMDGDEEYPTICGTGTEDYFGGAWNFTANFSAPFMGYPMGQCSEMPGNRHLMYRFHIMDPIRFSSDLRVTIQAIGWRSEGRYLPLQDDISSVAYWYQAEPHVAFPALPDKDYLEVI